MKHQELNTTFPKTLKNHKFLQVFAPTHLPRDHPYAQNCSQEAAKKIHKIKKKCQKYHCVVKNALSRRSQNDPFLTKNCHPKLHNCLTLFNLIFSISSDNLIQALGPMVRPVQPKSAQNAAKDP